MQSVTERERVRFASTRESCAGWHYPGTNGGCVVMAGGLAVPKEPATDRFARRFHEAGFAILAFDYRRLGESDGTPRLVMSVREAHADWRAAIAFARTLDDVDPGKVALWGFSASAGHLFPVAASDPNLAAVIAQTPLVDAPAVASAVLRHSTPLAQLRLTGRAILDALGAWIGRSPLLVPLAGEPGTVAMLSTPDALQGDTALHGERYPEWQQMVAARTVLRLSVYRPGRHAARITSPLLVVVCDDDRSTPPGPAVQAAERAPRGEVAHLFGRHYAPFVEAHENAVEIEVAFLERHLL